MSSCASGSGRLNKGEQLQALRRHLFYTNEGHLRQRTPEQKAEQALCLTIASNAIIVWNTVYTQRVLDTSEIERISPLPHQHIHTYGHCPFDLAVALSPTGRYGPTPADRPVKTRTA